MSGICSRYAEMALASDQAVTISGPTAFASGARLTTARREGDLGGQNAQIADRLRQVADIVAAQRADSFHIAAYCSGLRENDRVLRLSID